MFIIATTDSLLNNQKAVQCSWEFQVASGVPYIGATSEIFTKQYHSNITKEKNASESHPLSYIGLHLKRYSYFSCK